MKSVEAKNRGVLRQTPVFLGETAAQLLRITQANTEDRALVDCCFGFTEKISSLQDRYQI